MCLSICLQQIEAATHLKIIPALHGTTYNHNIMFHLLLLGFRAALTASPEQPECAPE